MLSSERFSNSTTTTWSRAPLRSGELMLGFPFSWRFPHANRASLTLKRVLEVLRDDLCWCQVAGPSQVDCDGDGGNRTHVRVAKRTASTGIAGALISLPDLRCRRETPDSQGPSEPPAGRDAPTGHARCPRLTP